MFIFNKKNKITNKDMKERIEKALKIAWSYGQYNGNHYKTWVIDQMVRALCGNDEEYKKFVDVYEAPVGYEDYFKWNTGVAPENYMDKN